MCFCDEPTVVFLTCDGCEYDPEPHDLKICETCGEDI